MLTASFIFFGLKSSTLVSELYGLLRRILYVICIAPYCNIIVPLIKKLCYHKRDSIWRFIFACSLFSEHGSISNFIVIVNCMFILTGVISINLRLFLLMYKFQSTLYFIGIITSRTNTNWPVI